MLHGRVFSITIAHYRGTDAEVARISEGSRGARRGLGMCMNRGFVSFSDCCPLSAVASFAAGLWAGRHYSSGRWP
jgi:hypothetical protein